MKEIFVAAGLKEEQAEVYALLLEHGKMYAGQIAKKVSMKHGLLYKTLHELVAKQYVTQGKDQGKMCFWPVDPERVCYELEREADALQKRLEHVRFKLPEIRMKYAAATERPMIKYFEGLDGLKEMYLDRLEYRDMDHYFVRPGKVAFYERYFGQWFQTHLRKVAEAHIRTNGITADDPETTHSPERDKLRGFIRTWVREEDYTAPVEVYIYANKVSIISFGKEIFGVLIENTPIAQGFTELFLLARAGAETRDVTHDHFNKPNQEKL